MSASNPLEDVDKELLANFIEESREHLEIFGDGLLEMEGECCDPDTINAVFRGVHTIKGCAAMLECTDIGRLAHVGENVLDAVRSKQLNASPPVLEALFAAHDLLVSLLDDAAELKAQGQRDDEIDPLLVKLTAALTEGSADEASFVRPTPAQVQSPQPSDWPAPGTGLSTDLISQFLGEATENLDLLGSMLLEFEKEPTDVEVVNSIFRAVHTIKGNSSYVGLAQITSLAHRLENVLDLVRGNDLDVTEDVSSLIFDASDALRSMVDTLQPDAETGADMRVLVTRLDQVAGQPTVPGEIAVQAPGTQGDPQLAIFIQSAEQHIDSILACYAKLDAGDLSIPVVSAMQRSTKTLINAAEYSERDDFLGPARRLLEVVSLVCEGLGEFDELTLSEVDQQSAELEKLLQEITAQVASDECSRLSDGIVDQSIASRGGGGSAAAVSEAIDDKIVSGDTASIEPLAGAAGLNAPEDAPKKAVSSKTIRVDQLKLDEYINLAGELVIARNGLLHAFGKLELDGAELREMKDTIEGVNRITTGIQDNSMGMRMIPVKSVFQRFPRMLRDLAKAQGKKIELKVFGEDTELDKQVAEALGDPLVHLIRNSADHGIESPEERRKAGKSETGLVILKAAREGNTMVIEITDDGAGINVDRLKAKSVENGNLSQEEADEMSREAALDLIFSAGLSTAEQVSDISGRGVGMDVVRTNISSLRGSVSVSSEEGSGSSLRIQLPLTLAVTTVVVVGCNGETFALPMEAVNETVKVKPAQIQRLKGEWAISLRGEIVALKKLSDLLALERGQVASIRDQDNVLATDSTGQIPITVVTAGEVRYGLVVDEFKGQQEIVVKSLAGYMSQLPGLGGATIMGDGTIVLVLDPMQLFALATGEQAPPGDRSSRCEV